MPHFTSGLFTPTSLQCLKEGIIYTIIRQRKQQSGADIMDLLFIFWGFILMMLYFTEFETCRAPSSPLCRTHARIGNSWAEWSTFVNKMKKIVSLFKEKLSTINILNLFSGIFMNKLCNQFGNRIWLFNMRKMPAFGYLTNNCIWQFTVQPLHCIFRQMRSYSICNNSYIWFHAKDKRQQSHSRSSIIFQFT